MCSNGGEGFSYHASECESFCSTAALDIAHYSKAMYATALPLGFHVRPRGAFEARWHSGPSTGNSPSLCMQSAPVLVQHVFGVLTQCPAAVGTCSVHPRVAWTRWKMYRVNPVSYDSAGTISGAPQGR